MLKDKPAQFHTESGRLGNQRGIAEMGGRDVIQLDTVVCGDCAQVIASWPDACIDLTVTSPPYDNLRTYEGYVFDFEATARQLYRVTKPGGVVV